MFAYFWGQIIFCRIISNVYLQSSDVSDDVNDFKALTPNHFTIGSKKSTFGRNGAGSRLQQRCFGTRGNENTYPC